MEPMACPYCGTRSRGQGPNCANCGAALSAFPAQFRPDQVRLTPTPLRSQPRRRTSGVLWLIITLLGVVLGIGGAVFGVLAGFGVFNGLEGVSMSNTNTPGWWKATAPGLGTFQFKMNPDQTAITDFVFQIPGITCPGISYSVSDVQVHNDPPWTVSQGHFDADVTLDDGLDSASSPLDVDVSGSLASGGQFASGSWVFDGESAPCQGSWTAHPAQR